MFTPYTISAANKILKRFDINFLEVWHKVIFVKFTNGQARFIKKSEFWTIFHSERKARGASLICSFYGEDHDRGEIYFNVESSQGKDPYFVECHNKGVNCECKDWRMQHEAKFNHPICKHGWKAINTLGYNQLSDYLNSKNPKMHRGSGRKIAV